MTTKAIKRGQYDPAEVRRTFLDNRWLVPSRTRKNVEYVVSRQGNDFSCGCKATSPTCYHVTSVVMRELAEKGWVGQVWTSREEAQRQRRKIWELRRNGRTFWVTGRAAPWVRRPDKRARFKYAKVDQWRPVVTDCYWRDAAGPFRLATTRR